MNKQKNKTNNYTSFWDNSDDYNVDEFLGKSIEVTKGKDVIALASYKRAISNFVNIITEDNIPVHFSDGDDSYTDSKSITIGSNLDDKKFDIAVGLALHEASHIKLTDFNYFQRLTTIIPTRLLQLANTKGITVKELHQLVSRVFNYIEDRRIDNFIFSTSPGYKGYYHSMYDKYFYSTSVDKGLLSSELREESIDSYMFRLINLHNKNRQLGALTGLKEIHSLIGLNDIGRLKDSTEAGDVVFEVARVILDSIDKVETESQDSSDDSSSSESGESGENGENGESTNGDSGSENGNDNNKLNDDGSESNDLKKTDKATLKKMIEKQNKFIDNEIRKTRLSKKDKMAVEAVSESGASYQHVGENSTEMMNGQMTGNGTKCLVVKKLTQNLIDSNLFGCACSYHQKKYSWGSKYNFVEDGLRLGNMLGRKLKVRGEETSLKYNRKNNGKIDKRMLSELGFGNTNVFSQTFVEKYNKAYIHISVDASGSMNGNKWNKAMTSAVAMIKACDMAGNIDVVVSIRSTHNLTGSYGGKHDVPLILIAYDSRVDKLSKVRSLFPGLGVSGTTPEGLCFEAIMEDLIPGNNNQDSYFINYSDGQPCYSNSEIEYYGNGSRIHTKKMVNEMRNRGLKVMSYFVTSRQFGDNSIDAIRFRQMYGKDALMINVTNMMEVAKTMNNKFLEKTV